MRFSKYQGIGNDFVLIADPEDRIEITEPLAARLCDRRFGVGADGVIRVVPGREGADLVMDYRNSDGSLGEMCGNGIRCVAVFARENGMTDADEVRVATGAGIKTVSVLDGGRVKVDMGPPIFEAGLIPVLWEDDPLHAKLETEDEVLEAACVSMGNPHAVLFVDDPGTAPVTTLGPALERHELFPNGANIEFARVVAPDRLEMRVWERGSGETLACGTGACAVAVVAREIGGADEIVTVSLPGGKLEIEWHGSSSDERPVFMTGPTQKSFDGDLDLDAYK